MRIIGGTFKGRIVKLEKGLPVRPTTDKTKEALFNMLNSRVDLEGLRVLDLCCGSGNISLEFASRGAASVTSVDKHPKVLAAMRQHFKDFDYEAQGRVVQSDLFKFVETDPHQYDLVFIDPPYALPDQDRLITTLFARNMVPEDGWVVLEHLSLKRFDHVAGFSFTRKYGTSSVSFFQPE